VRSASGGGGGGERQDGMMARLTGPKGRDNYLLFMRANFSSEAALLRQPPPYRCLPIRSSEKLSAAFPWNIPVPRPLP